MTTATASNQANWALDLSHSEVTFKVKHMMISTVSGRFSQFNVAVDGFDGKSLEGASIQFSADAASILSGNDQRDAHLRSADFFNADEYPQISFQSTSIVKKSDAEYEVNGDLTMRGTAKPVRLNVDFGGVLNDPWGNAKAGFTLEGKINRGDFGLNWNAALEAGGWLVAEEVKIYAEIQLTHNAA